MKPFPVLPLIMAPVVFVSCGSPSGRVMDHDSLPNSNPFSSVSTLPFQAPAFDKIKSSDFKPALEAGIKQKMADIQKISDNPDSPTFENTILPLERAGALLERVQLVFNLLTAANTNPELQAVQEAIAPQLAAATDGVYLNDKLFKRINTLYEQREQLKLDSESRRLLEYDEQQFELAGAKLSDTDKERLKELNKQEASLSTRFANRLLAATRAGALVVNDSSELKGLSSSEMDAAAQKAKADSLPGKWVISLQNTTQ